MNGFTDIRKAALAKRDAAIKKARSEYAETLRRISELEQDILGREPSSHKSISACIESLIPADRTFTTVDIMSGLQAMDNARVWRKRSIDNHISRLRRKGIIKRIKKSKGTEPAVYARVDADVEELPFQDLSLASVVEIMLKGKSMTQTELVVNMLEAGYETNMEKRALRDAVGVVLRGKPGKYRRNSGKWVCE